MQRWLSQLRSQRQPETTRQFCENFLVDFTPESRTNRLDFGRQKTRSLWLHTLCVRLEGIALSLPPLPAWTHGWTDSILGVRGYEDRNECEANRILTNQWQITTTVTNYIYFFYIGLYNTYNINVGHMLVLYASRPVCTALLQVYLQKAKTLKQKNHNIILLRQYIMR